ncbi:hypothetical protein QC763_0016920 [Podospora pseudopauciseta]|uniref:Uncharacterized protein n=2 Tax=Podospora TaxID=5144 RepID=A0ABR0I0R4_9PEZI|nr:hypothetical protein QC763_0016920 [Podospora pseudopauciseta]KAK4682216.1 hypothetical protein QC764_0016860 [Podospora pseudoanserina]
MRRLEALYDAGSWMRSIQGGKKWQNCFSEARTSCSVFGVLAKKFGGQMGTDDRGNSLLSCRRGTANPRAALGPNSSNQSLLLKHLPRHL